MKEPPRRALPRRPCPLDTDTIQRTIDRALAADHTTRYSDLAELEALLRGHINLMLPPARARAGTVAYARLNTAAGQLAYGLGDTLRSARRHVLLLALDCRWLLRVLAPGRQP
ncbi:DUF6415 family natural product biosynthesis protein [Streptomyces pini]|uniref:Uncharacterized protein n=1 Tax=Streptomyces pini TaxID=1520580 RepID=A0A1I4BX79_9ACTN|nr:DUF6415 family natural product biosynthesis protein [Streptomyces pini]SFK72616.1 hypothetical protein SAMN05192584_108150 [Streptomyces pini]